MSGHKDSVKPPKCSGKRKDGSACNSFASEDGLCSYHLRLRDEGGTTTADEVVLRGPVKLLPIEPEPDVALDAPGGIREHFRAAASTYSGKIVDSLVETLDAYTTRRVRCPNKGCNLEFPVQLPDGGARVKASEALVELGYGTPPKDLTATTETVDLGVDPFSLDADALRAHREAIARAYPEAAAQFESRVAEEKERDRAAPSRVSAVVPRARRAKS